MRISSRECDFQPHGEHIWRGEVDAGFVYSTDVQTAHGRVQMVAQLATKKPVEYPIAAIAASSSQRLRMIVMA